MWTDLFAMIEDMQKRVLAGDAIEPHDDPRRLAVGYCSLVDEWLIGLHAVMKAVPKNRTQALILSGFRGAEFRAQLCRRGSL